MSFISRINYEILENQDLILHGEVTNKIYESYSTIREISLNTDIDLLNFAYTNLN
jgi:hypothetical protein